ncbi:MAG TPA: hypothetical protein DCF45_06125, partial [Gammaproteobacteria bacterium]|nr:hypothetical protein [Gammaproteobacteria bacterium]
MLKAKPGLRERKLRIAISGCAGIGKSTLARALADRLDISHVDEHYSALFSPPGTFNSEAIKLIPLFNRVLAEKNQLMQQTGTFVVDRTALDLLNLWMARGLTSYPQATADFSKLCQAEAATYDLVIFPPWGTLPHRPHDATDGRIRVSDPWIQLRNHAAILGLTRMWVDE